MKKGILEGKTAVITGASRGIGRATALRFAQEGAWVLLNCTKNTSQAEAVLKEIEELKAKGEAPPSAGGIVKAFSVTDDTAVREAFSIVQKERKAIDILVNNAGIKRDTVLMRHSEADWDEVLATNLKGAFLCTSAVSRPMMKAKSGSIIYISSMVGQAGNPGQASYCASKAGLFGLMKSVAKELGSRNIRINAIAPGFIKTDMTHDIPESARQATLGHIPIKRFGEAAEVANVALWLASTESSYVTGQTIGVNGGLYM